MPSTKIMIASLFSVFALLDGALAGKLTAFNNCKTPVWAGAAANDLPATPPTKVAPGGSFTPPPPYETKQGGPGVTLKVASPDDEAISSPVQLPAAIDGQGGTFYQVTTEDGDPFNGKYSMQLPKGQDCKTDIPGQQWCAGDQDIVLTVCAS